MVRFQKPWYQNVAEAAKEEILPRLAKARFVIPHFLEAKDVLLKPAEFFYRSRKTVKDCAKFVIVLSFLQFLLSLLFAVKFYTMWSDALLFLVGKMLPPPAFILGLTYLFIFFFIWIAGLGAMIIVSLLTHLYFILFGNTKSKLEGTAAAITYGLSPYFILGWIPYASLVGWAWSICLIIYALYKEHEIERVRFTLMILAVFLAITSALLYVMGY